MSDKPTVTCPECKGTGYGNGTILCSRCGGLGHITVSIFPANTPTKNKRVFPREVLQKVYQDQSHPEVDIHREECRHDGQL